MAYEQLITTSDVATSSSNGAMSAADKKKLDGIAAGAQVNTVTGVKGNSESSYRTGNINITAANVGLGNVTNESKATMFTSAALTGTPTAPTAAASTNTTQIATTAFVQSAIDTKIAAADAMIYKGTIGSSGATITALPNTHYTGWTYKVATAGTYAGVACEVGDMIICLTDGTSANNAHWTVVQTNLDGAVTGPASAVNARVAVFNGTTGKIIKDSGYTIASSVPSGAKFTDTDTKMTQTANTGSTALPILIGASASPSGAATGAYASGVTVTPSTKTVTATTFAGALSGNASTATKLATARKISLGTGATGTATAFDGSEDILIPVTSVRDTYIDWGGRNLNGTISPIGASLSAEHAANRLAFLNPNAITIEMSHDGGSTWSDSGYADDTKVALVTKSGTVSVGDAVPVTTNHRTRITLTAQDGTNSYVYTRPCKMLIDVSTPHGLSVLIEYKTGASGASWQTLGTYPVSGWSGWNDIPIGLSTFGGGASQTSNVWYMRLTFINTSVNSSYNTDRSSIRSIRLFGVTSWIATSNMGAHGHLYSYDTSQNANFPAKVTATGFSGPLSGNASTATKATQDSAGQQINTTYIKELSVSGKTITIKKGDGTTSTQTTQDTTYGVATTSANGLMSSTDKSKLDGIAAGAQVNSITGVKGNSESSYRTGQVNITAANIGLGNVGNFKAVSTVASQGLSDTEKANARTNIGAGTSSLTIGTTSSTAAAGNHTHSAATTSANGLMSSTDKAKVDTLKKVTEVTGTLSAGSTSITLSNAAITTSSYIDIYTSVYGVNPNTVTVSAGKVVMTFSAQSSALSVMIHVR